MKLRWIIQVLTLILAMANITHQIGLPTRRPLGACYSTQGNDLPKAKDVINLYIENMIQMIRLFEPQIEILEALRGSNLKVLIGIKNEDISTISSNQEAANTWIKTNILPYKDDVIFGWITAGNNLIPGPLAQYIPGAMNNIHTALKQVGLQDRIKVTTAVSTAALEIFEIINELELSFRPSKAVFAEDYLEVMTKIGYFLAENAGGGPLMINVYPYYMFAKEPGSKIPLDFALFESKEPLIKDGYYEYYNMFDALVDAFNAALEALNVQGIYVAISGTGWPSAGTDKAYANMRNAEMYNNRLLKHVLQHGTPRRPDILYDVFWFTMFNENLKPDGIQRNFGFFYPNMTRVYPFW